MKLALVMIIVVIICGGGAAWLYVSTRPHIAPPQGEVTLREKSGFVASFPATSDETEAILSWFWQHQTGWRPSFVTYAPQTTFSCDTFQINIFETGIVLNYSRSGPAIWNQLSRSLSKEEREFWQQIVVRIKQPNQAMQPPFLILSLVESPANRGPRPRWLILFSLGVPSRPS